MKETAADLERLQSLLDRSYRAAGPHLASIHTPDRRMGAAALAGRLRGVRILAVATTTADGRPLSRPVDGLFYRGEFWFGSAPGSLLMRHLAARPSLSAVHTAGEHLAVTVHGEAAVAPAGDPARAGFDELAVEVYGREWSTWGATAVYARLAALRMFAFSMEEPGA